MNTSNIRLNICSLLKDEIAFIVDIVYKVITLIPLISILQLQLFNSLSSSHFQITVIESASHLEHFNCRNPVYVDGLPK